MGLIPEDRKIEGIFQNLSVEKNITISDLKFCSEQGVVRKSRENDTADQLIGDLRIKASSRIS